MAPTTIVFDIETGPLPFDQISALAPEFEAPSNYKDPEKIAAAIEAKRDAWLARAALSPLTGQVLAIGMLIDGEYHALIGEESGVISQFWNVLTGSTTLIGFNSHRFDLPFLVRRSWAHGLVPPRVHDRGYPRSTDLMEVFQQGDRQEFTSLDTVAKFLGVGAKNGSGAHFAELMKFDESAALAYLENDIHLTAKVAERLGINIGSATGFAATAPGGNQTVPADEYDY
jgi:predicted PolB exonuclease-like 3'-5' exonuclease